MLCTWTDVCTVFVTWWYFLISFAYIGICHEPRLVVYSYARKFVLHATSCLKHSWCLGKCIKPNADDFVRQQSGSISKIPQVWPLFALIFEEWAWTGQCTDLSISTLSANMGVLPYNAVYKCRALMHNFKKVCAKITRVTSYYFTCC